RQQYQWLTPLSARAFNVFFKFSSTQFLRAMIPLTLEETARILCEPDTHFSQFERAISLFGLQIAAVSPTLPQLAADARLHAAMRILEHIEQTQGGLDGISFIKRLALPEFDKIVNQMLAGEEICHAI